MLLAGVLLAGPGWAQDLPDASLPDASVGEGGADHTSEENDPSGPCLSSRDCDLGFLCQAGRCVPGTVRDATFSCRALDPALAGLAAGLVLLTGRRRRR